MHLAAHLSKANLTPVIDQLQSISDAMVEQCFHDCPETWNVSEADMQAGARYANLAKKAITGIIYGSNAGIV
jgi:hypothetical protein